MLLSLSAICVAIALLSMPAVLRMKRIRDRREMEQHSITAEELHSLLASNQDVLLLMFASHSTCWPILRSSLAHGGFRQKKCLRRRH